MRAPCAALTTVRPKLFRRASLTSWGKDNLGMTRAAADLNLTELMLTVQQQKVISSRPSNVCLPRSKSSRGTVVSPTGYYSAGSFGVHAGLLVITDRLRYTCLSMFLLEHLGQTIDVCAGLAFTPTSSYRYETSMHQRPTQVKLGFLSLDHPQYFL